MKDFEKLGAFYLGRVYDAKQDSVGEDLVLYDSKDLTTHAVCVGMTGSGKTGLCISLLEEAGIDGIPAIVIDPKGDLGNLFLTFPEQRAADFRPWIDPAEAARKGMEPDEYAVKVAQTWKQGLSQWGQDGSRIKRFREQVELALYTPGSTAGRPLRVLRSLAAPSAEVAADGDALRDRIQAVVSGLLSLLGIEADPIRSREHILLSNLVDRAWREGQDLELAGLIAAIQSPPFERLGVLDLESFFPAKDRFELAMSLNNLLASPGFAAWMEGEPLDVGRLLYTAEGRPRMSILSIAHLSERERMFFVTLLLNEMISWMRAQPGTSSLRALLYMDEIFGFFPPTANPPSKTPMLTLLKQARAYGVGVVLATQNPVDLDYKGLSNTGTWFLGRLQTERDKARVLDGLEGAMATAGGSFDRGELDKTLSGLSSRVFLMNNVHEDRPELMHTRWALSYLRGPLTRQQIRTLAGKAPMEEPCESVEESLKPRPKRARKQPASTPAPRPLVPPGVDERFLPATRTGPTDSRLIFRPSLLATARLHYVDRKADVDHWETLNLMANLGERVPTDPWAEAESLADWPDLVREARSDWDFAELPAAAARKTSYDGWRKKLASSLYRDTRLNLQYCPLLKLYSRPGQSDGEFRASLRHAAHERRDLEMEKLRKRYAPKLARMQERIARADEKVERERDQYKYQKVQTAVSLGATVLGALFGRKVTSASSVGKATTAMRGASRAARERQDISRAAERADELRDRLEELEAEFEQKVAALGAKVDADRIEVEERPVRPRKSDIAVELLTLVWTPYWESPGGICERAF